MSEGLVTCITGHRPEKLLHPIWKDVELYYPRLVDTFTYMDVNELIVGMASGFDLIAGFIAFCEGIPLICTVPWRGHKPRLADIDVYNVLLEYAKAVIYVDESEDYLGPWMYQERNQWMVDHSEQVISCWDGSKGGTYNCIKYADEQCRSILNINPADCEVSWLTSEQITSV